MATLPKYLIHGTTRIGENHIKKYGIRTRGFLFDGVTAPKKALDFGEGFYCTFNNPLCREKVTRLAVTRAMAQNSTPRILTLEVNDEIYKDRNLNWKTFEGNSIDLKDWTQFVAHHRGYNGEEECTKEPCLTHPDVIIGPVADGTLINVQAQKLIRNEMTLDDFIASIIKAEWFPNYRQVVFGENAIKYLSLVY
jgi:hypothetical protein